MTKMENKKNLNSSTDGRLLARNAIWNLLGQSVPLVVAIFAIPLLIKGLGTDRFGFLTIVWMVIGYFSLFDLGLGRALTKLVAERLSSDKEQEIPPLVWTATALMLILGTVGGLILGLISPWLVYSMFKIPDELQSESLYALLILAASIPVCVVTAGFVGILAAKQRFDLITWVRIPTGALAYLSPIAVLPFSKSLVMVTAVLFLIRIITLLINLVQCLLVLPVLRVSFRIKRAVMRPLLSLGGWMTVTNVVSPLMVSLDRFFIGAIISVSAVAYYTTPFEAVTKLWTIPFSLTGVLFPAFAVSFLTDANRASKLFARGVKYIFLCLFPIILLIVAFSHEGLNLWLGEEFAQNSTSVLQLLAIGVLINSLAHIPFSYIQSAGRPDLTAKLHLVELPLYLVAVWWVVGAFGIVGVALVWTIRITVDAVAMFLISRIFLKQGLMIGRNTILIGAGSLLALACTTLPLNTLLKVVMVAMFLMVFTAAAWFIIFDQSERAMVQKRLRIAHVLK